jgi:hypothetical protein
VHPPPRIAAGGSARATPAARLNQLLGNNVLANYT